ATSTLVGIDKRSGYPRWMTDKKYKCPRFWWYPKSMGTSAFTASALYYENGRWVAVNAGATTEGAHQSTYDFGDGKYTPAGALPPVIPPWSAPWSKSLPTVTVCFPLGGNPLSVGVVVGTGSAPPNPNYPPAPANTYRLIQSPLNWTQAREDAVKRGGYLASITSPDEWSNILKQIGTAMLNKEVWIGATDEGQEGNWRWLTGETWNYTRWAGGQPNNNGGQHYGHLWAATGNTYGWDDVKNVIFPYYLLEINGTQTPPPPPPPLPDPDPVVNTYRLIQSSLTWHGAVADAVKRGGYLATITSAAEWTELLKQVGSAMLNKEVWIGATDEGKEGTWRWVTGETWKYARWASGQPNNSGGRQHYGHLWAATGSAYGWDDVADVIFPYYLLEIDKTETPPPPDPVVNTYRLIQSSFTWQEALADAVKRGGYLATVTSAAEWTELVNQVGAAALAGREVWLGATDEAKEGTWRWVTGENWSYSRWAAGQPNNARKKQHYLHLWAATGSQLAWDDMENTACRYYLLEIPAAQSAQAKAAARSAPRPVEIASSGGVEPEDNVWNLLDGNRETVWAAAPDANGWWLAMSFAEPVDLSGLTLDWADGSSTTFSALWSSDASAWGDLSEALEKGPVSLSYLWLIFPDEGSGRSPAIREIEIE
ncbi:MAG: hypothetical protein KKC51_02740, partial [Verrucomicrobia bacterium]|nr:hypothetical protein [Verrucomicrobiota bacterium]